MGSMNFGNQKENKMSFNKLVRDRIPEIIENEGRKCNYHILNEQDYIKELKIKLNEEVNEFLESDNPEELADILEVVYALSKVNNCSEEELNNIRTKKSEKRGAFEKRIFLEE